MDPNDTHEDDDRWVSAEDAQVLADAMFEDRR